MDQSNLTDEEIVRITREDDKEFYIHLVRRYEDKLLRYIRRYIKNEDIAQDVLQTTFIKAFENLNGFDLKKKFSSWIYRISHNEALNKIKRENRSVSGFDPEIFEILAENNNSPEKEYATNELKKMVGKCFLDLPTKYRDVLTLFYLEDKKYDEISDILRLPAGTVAIRISRGKKLLKEKCQKLI
ncbi:MAG: sigma-70 family RNA polymerase sigma factor [Patescibacteria group bacterium]